MRRLAPYYAYRAGAAAVRLAPHRVSAAAAGILGGVFMRRMRGRRAMVARHLQRVHGPQLQGRALDHEVRRTFDSYARYWLEVFRIPSMSHAEIAAKMSYEGLDRVDAALAEGRGVIIVTPHLGAWDFGGAWLGVHGGYRMTMVAEPVEPPELFEWFSAQRRELGLTVVPLGPSSGSAVLRALHANDLVALICDRDIGGSGVEVEFFGERTKLPAGPATLAIRTGAPILPVAVYYEGRDSHHAVVRPPVPVERAGRLRDDVGRVTQLIAGELEVLIRRAPEQWHLLQPNWPSDYDVWAS